MIIKSKSTGNCLNGLNKGMFNDSDFLSENLMKNMVQREMARIARTSEILSIAVVRFEKLLTTSTTHTGSEDQIKHFFKSVEKLKKNVRANDLIGWIKRDNTFAIVFTLDKSIPKENIEKRIDKILDISLNNANNKTIDLDVTMWSAEHDCAMGENVENTILTYFKKKKQFMSQELNE
jgi:hypothetical protein